MPKTKYGDKQIIINFSTFLVDPCVALHIKEKEAEIVRLRGLLTEDATGEYPGSMAPCQALLRSDKQPSVSDTGENDGS